MTIKEELLRQVRELPTSECDHTDFKLIVRDQVLTLILASPEQPDAATVRREVLEQVAKYACIPNKQHEFHCILCKWFGEHATWCPLASQPVPAQEQALRDSLKNATGNDGAPWEFTEAEKDIIVTCVLPVLANRVAAAITKRDEEWCAEFGYALSLTQAIESGVALSTIVSDAPIIEQAVAKAQTDRDDEWLIALLDTEQGGGWDTAKMEESAKHYREQICQKAQAEMRERAEQFLTIARDVFDLAQHGLWSGKRSTVENAKFVLDAEQRKENK